MEKLIDTKDRFYIAGHNGMAGSAISRSLIENKYKGIWNYSQITLED